jgi:hypothetical protein
LTRALGGTSTRAPKSRLRRDPENGAVAQLGERVVRNDEVRGSIPLGSTNYLSPDISPYGTLTACSLVTKGFSTIRGLVAARAVASSRRMASGQNVGWRPAGRPPYVLGKVRCLNSQGAGVHSSDGSRGWRPTKIIWDSAPDTRACGRDRLTFELTRSSENAWHGVVALVAGILVDLLLAGVEAKLRPPGS